jgi:hypothetical protein
MNDPDKERLTDFIYSRLPDLLRANGGKVRKEVARQIVHRKFADTQNGWPASLNELEGNGQRWTRAVSG